MKRVSAMNFTCRFSGGSGQPAANDASVEPDLAFTRGRCGQLLDVGDALRLDEQAGLLLHLATKRRMEILGSFGATAGRHPEVIGARLAMPYQEHLVVLHDQRAGRDSVVHARVRSGIDVAIPLDFVIKAMTQSATFTTESPLTSRCAK